ETLDSLRLVVGALRDPGEGPAGDGPPDSGAPVPGAAALDRLVRTERELGADVELVREGDPYDLPPIADVTVYRVAREALSNARDHAPGAPVRILLRYGASRVALRVDNGPGRGRGGGPQSDAPRGMGLIGMAERAQLVGAELEAGPREHRCGPGYGRGHGRGGLPVIRVLLVDDQTVVRAGFRVILDSADGIEVAGECADGPTAVELARRLRPDVICMDVRMPGGD